MTFQSASPSSIMHSTPSTCPTPSVTHKHPYHPLRTPHAAAPVHVRASNRPVPLNQLAVGSA